MPCQRVGCSEILVWLLWAPEDRSRRPSSISEITNTSPLIPSLDIAPMPQVYNALADTDKVILPSNRGIEGLARICPRRSVRVMQNCNIACLTPDYVRRHSNGSGEPGSMGLFNCCCCRRSYNCRTGYGRPKGLFL